MCIYSYLGVSPIWVFIDLSILFCLYNFLSFSLYVCWSWCWGVHCFCVSPIWVFIDLAILFCLYTFFELFSVCVFEADVEEFIDFGPGSSFISDYSLFFSKFYVHLQLFGVYRTWVFIDLAVFLIHLFLLCYALLAFRLVDVLWFWIDSMHCARFLGIWQYGSLSMSVCCCFNIFFLGRVSFGENGVLWSLSLWAL